MMHILKAKSEQGKLPSLVPILARKWINGHLGHLVLPKMPIQKETLFKLSASP
jgi:hypothetical protein